ncbi:MAG: toll/interleukin-1 receptor domain-containing protein [Rhodoplanes sp.]
MAKTDDVFTVFISHKHDDHALAVEVKKTLEGLARPNLIDCFVSGIDITAGMDWRHKIRSVLARSHVLLLLFTTPSKNWDWCLYETGLYTRFDKAEKNEISSVVCLLNPGQASPSPIADLQGVPAETGKVRDFLTLLCHETWKISDDWRQGALAPKIKPEQLDDAARAIERAFRLSGSTSTYYPCHRVVLSLSESDNIASGIPESAWVMEGPNDTSSYTLSLFDLASGTGKRTWGDLLQAVQGTDSDWRKELDAHFLLALKGELFWPTKGVMRAAGKSRVGKRVYRPILYSIVRGPLVGPSDDTAETCERPRSVTIVLTPEPLARATPDPPLGHQSAHKFEISR